MKYYSINSRPLPFDHPFSITVFGHDGKPETERLGNREDELEAWAKNYIKENP